MQEDKAPSHAHKTQKEVYNIHEIKRLLWPGNSPDLNIIEPYWYWMKRKATVRGAPKASKEMKKAWLQAWRDLPQARIREWIERIIRHIKEIIRLEGGNEYREGRTDSDKRLWRERRLKGKLSELVFLGQNQRTEQQFGQDSDLERRTKIEPSESSDSESSNSDGKPQPPSPPKTPVRRSGKSTVSESKKKKASGRVCEGL